MEINKIIQCDVTKGLPIENESIDMCITSPPYWGLRDYGTDGQLGLEEDYNEYIKKLCDVFDEVKRVLKPQGTCWINIGDTYNANWRGGKESNKKQNSNKGTVDFMGKKGVSEKCLMQIPSRFAIEMCNRGWILRNEIIWHKPNQMPTSIKDRFTMDFEKLFMFVKNKKYHFEQQKEDNRNMRTVWSINTKPIREAHFATYPEQLIEVPIKAGCPKSGIILDIFMGSGTTAIVAEKNNKKWLGCEINADYIKIAKERIAKEVLQTKLI